MGATADTNAALLFLSETTGAAVPALKLLLTLLSGYPLAIIHRNFLYGKAPHVQHMYFILTGFTLGYLNYGFEIFHSVFAVVFSYLTLLVFRGTATCVAITFIFNMGYLLTGYYYCGTQDYDINWTMPQCVLVLRLIGLSFDLYDGNQPEEKLSAKNKEVALMYKPSVIEYGGHMFFPSSFLIGPQFPMRRYQDFVSGKFNDNTNDSTIPPHCIEAALKRLALGFMYLAIYQTLSLVISDDYMMSEEFGNIAFWKRCLLLGAWGRLSLYKYISCWLITEGACIMFGLTHNGKDEKGNIKWDGLANIDIKMLESATQFNHYIQSFNTNTNHWVAQYIYKRLKFMGNRYISQFSTLLFLAVWHGFHSGYYVCFLFEFIVMFFEKDFASIMNKNPQLTEPLQSLPMKIIVYILLRLYTFVFMGWCLVPFVLLTYDRYLQAFSNVCFIGVIFFVPWGFAYGPLFRKFAKMTKRPAPAEHEE